MTKCFFIHGTPSSAESTAKNIFDGLEDRIFGEFFNGVKPTPQTCLICETRGWKGGLFTVYTYYASCTDFAGRNGPTYCALTLIVQDGTTAHIGTLYETLKKTFATLRTRYHCLDESNKFIINTFRDKPELLELSNHVVQEVKNVPFESIPPGFQKSGESTQPLCFNTTDIYSSAVIDGLKNQGKIYVAPDFPTLEQIASIEKAQEEEKRTANKRDGSLTQVDKEDLDMLQSPHEKTLYKNLMVENKALRSENEALRERLAEQSAESYDNAYPVDTETSFFRGIRPIEWLIVANFILLIACLVSVFYNANRPSANSKQSVESIELLKERCDSLKRTIELLKGNTPAKIDTIKKSIANDSDVVSL